jgi:hypothetical protein
MMNDSHHKDEISSVGSGFFKPVKEGFICSVCSLFCGAHLKNLIQVYSDLTFSFIFFFVFRFILF